MLWPRRHLRHQRCAPAVGPLGVARATSLSPYRRYRAQKGTPIRSLAYMFTATCLSSNPVNTSSLEWWLNIHISGVDRVSEGGSEQERAGQCWDTYEDCVKKNVGVWCQWMGWNSRPSGHWFLQCCCIAKHPIFADLTQSPLCLNSAHVQYWSIYPQTKQWIDPKDDDDDEPSMCVCIGTSILFHGQTRSFISITQLIVAGCHCIHSMMSPAPRCVKLTGFKTTLTWWINLMIGTFHGIPNPI